MTKPPEGNSLPFTEDPLRPPETAAERWLYSLSRFGMKPGLANMEALLDRFDHPERDLRFLHLAGSNGKGSTALFLDSLLRAAGLSVGLFTSPHLLHVGERVRVDGQSLSEAELSDLLALVEEPVREVEATFFETMTLLSLIHFRRRGVDRVVWETGLGGRLDSTNVVESEAAILPTVSLDHSRYLGESLEEILLEKLAIARAGRPFYTALQDGPLLELARKEAGRRGFDLRELGQLLPHEARDGHLDTFGRWPKLSLPSPLPVQGRNAALALLSLSDLEARSGESLLPPDPAPAIASTRLPGRFDIVRSQPPLVVDGAHNPEALSLVLDSWKNLAREGTVIFSCMEDKEIIPLLASLTAAPGRVIFTASGQRRSLSPAHLRAEYASLGQKAEEAPNLSQAMSLAGPDQACLITGSFYLCAEAYYLLERDPWKGHHPASSGVSRPNHGINRG